METSDQEFVKTVQRWEWFKSKGALLFQIIGVLYAFLVCYPQKFIGIILGLAVLLFPAVFVVVTALAALVVLGWDDPFAWSLAVFLTINTIGNVVMGAKLKRFQFDTPAAQVTHREPILKTLKRLLKSPITIQALAGVVIICIVSLLAIFVWPTRYSYDHIKEGSNTFPVRIDRLTGKTATLYREGGWVSTDPTAMTTPTPRAPEIQDIPEDQVNLVIGTATLSWNGLLQMQVYNGSQWKLSEITVSVTVFNKENYVGDRHYRISCIHDCEPLTTAQLSALLGFNYDQKDKWFFSIIKAKGLLPNAAERL